MDDPDFESWYKSAWPLLVRVVAVATASPGDAEDIAAEACSHALQRWDRVCEMDDPLQWTLRVALNLSRRRSTRAVRELRLWIRRQEAQSTRDPVPSDVWDAVARLPVKQRQAVALRYVLDMTQHDVARFLGVADGTVAAALNAARRNLAVAPEISRGRPLHGR